MADETRRDAGPERVALGGCGPCREKHIGDLWFEDSTSAAELIARQTAILEAVGSAIERLERQMAPVSRVSEQALELVQQHVHLADGTTAIRANAPSLRGQGAHPGALVGVTSLLVERVEQQMSMFWERAKPPADA